MSVESLLAALRVSPPMKPLQAWPCAWQAPAVEDASAWARAQLAALGPAIMEAQLRLYAHQRQSVLVVLQGMDTSGKDGLIRRVFTHVNPVGLRVQSFRAPSAAEQRHHFLWRACRGLPEPGCISVYNRSYYEEVMYLRVHPEQRPQVIEDKDIVGSRLLQINRFEADLERRGISVVKVFLHISKAEQARRLLRRANNPQRSWKLQAADLLDRQMWSAHLDAFHEAIAQSTPARAPWYVVPADNKWIAGYLVGELLLATLVRLAPQFLPLGPAREELCEQVRLALGAEDDD